MPALLNRESGQVEYRQDTENTQGELAAFLDEDAVEPFQLDMTGAVCVAQGVGEWVPETEEPITPDEFAAACRTCEARPNCLIWATSSRSAGYWAGTTTQDRQRLLLAGTLTPAAADRHRARQLAAQSEERRRDQETALHEPGSGSLKWYRRRGCRCGECRAENAANRSRERVRLRAAA